MEKCTKRVFVIEKVCYYVIEVQLLHTSLLKFGPFLRFQSFNFSAQVTGLWCLYLAYYKSFSGHKKAEEPFCKFLLHQC